MKKINLIVLTFSILLVLILSCTDSTEPDNNGKISGNVTNSSGEPIPDAKIMLTYYTESIDSRPTVLICFFLTESSDVTLWISHHNEPDTVIILIDQFLNAGAHAYYWDSKNSDGQFATSNYYDYHIQTNDSLIKNKILLNREYNNISGNDVNSYDFFASTDNNGDYDFAIDKLPFSFLDNELEIFDESGELIDIIEVSRTVKIWAIHNDYDPVFIDSVFVNENSTTEGNLIFD